MHSLIRRTFQQLAFLGLATAGVLATTGVAQAGDSQFLNRAERALATGHPAEAISVLEASEGRLYSDVQRADAQGLRCQALLALDDAQAALAACESAVKLDQGLDSWRYWNNLGAAHLYLGDWDAAESAFETALDVSGWRRQQVPISNLRLLRKLRAAEAAAHSSGIAGVTVNQ